jgi:tetratricopeptide (TPR) repeat protein
MTLRACLALCVLLLPAGCSGEAGPAVPFDPSTAEPALGPVLDALRAGDGAAALSRLEELAAQGPLPDGAAHYRALALEAAGRPDEAEATWRAELQARPGNGRAHALLARRLLDTGRLDEAAAHLDQARRFAPDWPPARLLDGRLALARNDDELALRAFRDVLAQDPWGESAVEAHTALAQLLARRGVPDQELARRHADMAQHLQRLYAYLDSYRSRLRRDPSDAEAAYGVATACLDLYVRFGDVRLRDQAEDALEHVLALRPDDARALYNLGFVRARQSRLGEALELSQRAVELDPQLVPARVNLALLHAQLGQRAEAVAQLQLLARDATDPQDRLRAHAELARLLAEGEDRAEREAALLHARAALELAPDDPHGLLPLRSRLELELAPPAAAPEGAAPGTGPASPASEPDDG